MQYFRLEQDGGATPITDPSGDYVAIKMVDGKPCIETLSVNTLNAVQLYYALSSVNQIVKATSAAEGTQVAGSSLGT
jgi:hypothetical protein